jgi:hypothetical protein
MASQGDPTQPRQPVQPPPPAPAPEAGIDLTTLFLSAVASAAAAYVTSKIWAPGTLFSAAMSPVIVALVKEGLRKPTEVVTSAVPALPRPASFGRSPAGPPRVHEPLPDDLGDHLEAGAPPPFPPPAPGHEAGPVRVYSTRGRRLRWRLAVVTGLLGFAICVVLYTVPEIISGKSVGRSGQATTFFPGKTKHKSKSTTTTITTTTSTQQTQTAPSTTAKTTPEKTTTEPAQTVTQTVTTPAPAPNAATAPGQTPTTTTPPGQGPPPAQTTP